MGLIVNDKEPFIMRMLLSCQTPLCIYLENKIKKTFMTSAATS